MTIAANAPTRPALRYHGGKWRIAHWVLAHLPKHEVYVEAFGGAGSVLLRKPRSKVEVWNDVDDELVNYFRVLRDPESSQRLIRQLELTPHSRAEFHDCCTPAGDDVERARRLVVRAFQGVGANPMNVRVGPGWRTMRRKSLERQQYGVEWASWPEQIHALNERLRCVSIDNRPWRRILQVYDTEATLWYLDPPYPLETRSRKHRCTYSHELTDSDHVDLCQKARGLKGMVVLSSYPNPIYDEALSDWRRVLRSARAQTGAERTEALYMSPRAAAALDQGSLWGGGNGMTLLHVQFDVIRCLLKLADLRFDLLQSRGKVSKALQLRELSWIRFCELSPSSIGQGFFKHLFGCTCIHRIEFTGLVA